MTFKQYTPVDMARLPPDALDPVLTQMDNGAPETWLRVGEMIYLALRASNSLEAVSSEALGRCATEAVYQLVAELGGEPLYVPKGVLSGCHKRDKSIRDEFTGNNIAELAKKHGITPVRIRQVLAKGRSHPIP